MKQKPDLSFWKLWNLSFGFSEYRLPTPYKAPISPESLQRWGLTHTT